MAHSNVYVCLLVMDWKVVWGSRRIFNVKWAGRRAVIFIICRDRPHMINLFRFNETGRSDWALKQLDVARCDDAFSRNSLWFGTTCSNGWNGHLPPGRPHLEDHRQHEYKKNEMKRKSREHVEKACPFDGTSETRKSKAARPKLKNSIAWEGVQVLLLLFWKLFTSLNRCVKCISPHFIYSDCLIYIYLSSCSWYITWCGMRYVSAAIAAI